jgi:hypothetical protein
MAFISSALARSLAALTAPEMREDADATCCGMNGGSAGWKKKRM